MVNSINISSRIAGAILLHKGEITLSEINALPLVENNQTAEGIVAVLFRLFNVERHQRKSRRYDISFWEEVIELKEESSSHQLAEQT